MIYSSFYPLFDFICYLCMVESVIVIMASWYDKYLTIYGKPFSEVPQDVIDGTRERLARLQSPEPLASIVVIGYNEEKHLQACLWAISEIKCKYPVEIIGVDNDSTDRTAGIYEKSGIPCYTEFQYSCCLWGNKHVKTSVCTN